MKSTTSLVKIRCSQRNRTHRMHNLHLLSIQLAVLGKPSAPLHCLDNLTQKQELAPAMLTTYYLKIRLKEAK